MTQPGRRTPADVLREARTKDSARKRGQVFRTVDEMKRSGDAITFAAVARNAKVSQWLVYAQGVRDYITTAREAQEAAPLHAQRVGRAASDASLRTDLALARQDNRTLRAEIDRLKTVLRERLGAQIETAASESLRQRVDELTEANQSYRRESLRLTTELDAARTQLRNTEDDLTAARTSIRRMMRGSDQ